MPIYITGNSRSGTTMLSRILGNHESIFTFQELHFFDELLPGGDVNVVLKKEDAIKLYAKLCSIQRNGYFGNQNPEPFLNDAEIALKELNTLPAISIYQKFMVDETKRNGKTIPCKQTPQNIFSIHEILELIPGSKIIVMVRDPRSVLLSQKNKWKRRKLSGGKIPLLEAIRSRINYHPITISKIWRAAVEQGLKYSNDKRVLHVQYEHLVAHPEKVIEQVCKHAGTTYTHQLLDIPIIGSSNKLDSTNQRGVDKTKTSEWNKGGLTKTEIALCEGINAKLMSHFGYKLSGIKSNFFNKLRYQFTMPIRLSLSLLFNLKRLKNPKKLLKRFTS